MNFFWYFLLNSVFGFRNKTKGDKIQKCIKHTLSCYLITFRYILFFQPSIATATNIDTLLAGQENANQEISVPPEAVQDKVFFIFNNLSLANMDQKVGVPH